MPEKRRGLGRGLGALIPSSAEQEGGAAGVSTRSAERGRPVDLFFPSSASNGSTSEDGNGVQEGALRSAGKSSINKDALTAPSKRTNGRNQGASKKPASRKPRTSAPVPKEPVSGVVPDAVEAEAGPAAEPSTAPVSAPVEGASNDQEQVADTAPMGTAEEPGGAAFSQPGDEERQAEENVSDAYAEDNSEAKAADEPVSRETLREVPGARFAEVPVGSIHANRKQPRTVFDEDEMAELVHSVREIGVLQPIVVRASPEGGEYQYELVMGERRWRASREAGLETVPAIIRDTTDDDLLRDALLENLHRSQLNPLEEAAAYQQLLEDFGCSQEELAARIGRSRPQISNTLRLMKLPPLVQRRLAAGVLSAGHARALLGLQDPAEMEKLAQRIVAEGLSVRSTEEIVAMSDGLRRPSKPATPRAGARHERLDYLATSLSDRLDTNVKITLGAKKGRVSIEFASVDDLNRIMGVLTPTS